MLTKADCRSSLKQLISKCHNRIRPWLNMPFSVVSPRCSFFFFFKQRCWSRNSSSLRSSASLKSNEVKTCTEPFRINHQLDMNLFFTLQLAINLSSLSVKAGRVCMCVCVSADVNICVWWFVLISPLQTRRNPLRLVRSSLIFFWLNFLLFCSFCLPQISLILLPLDVP